MFDDWSKTHGGELASLNEFESTPEYLDFRAKARDNFINTYKGLVTVEAAPSSVNGAREELERRRKAKEGKQ